MMQNILVEGVFTYNRKTIALYRIVSIVQCKWIDDHRKINGSQCNTEPQACYRHTLINFDIHITNQKKEPL